MTPEQKVRLVDALSQSYYTHHRVIDNGQIFYGRRAPWSIQYEEFVTITMETLYGYGAAKMLVNALREEHAKGGDVAIPLMKLIIEEKSI